MCACMCVCVHFFILGYLYFKYAFFQFDIQTGYKGKPEAEVNEDNDVSGQTDTQWRLRQPAQ